MLNMGLFNYFSDLKSNYNEKKVAQAEALGHCPDCNGKGFQIPVVNEYFYPDSYDCPSCNGTGHYSTWSENKQSYYRIPEASIKHYATQSGIFFY